MFSTSSTFVGRVGGLAAALGTGAAIFAFAGAACAEPQSPGSPGAVGSQSSAIAGDSPTTRAGRLDNHGGRGPAARPTASLSRARTAATSAAHLCQPRCGELTVGSSRAVSGHSPAPAAARQPLSRFRASADAQTSSSASSTLILNGYAVVASTPLNITSYYGMYSTAPSTAGSVQGRQQFNLVDQTTGEIVGEFGALVLQNNSFGTRFKKIHTELLVTDVVDGTVGTDPGEVPPRFSRIGAIGDGTYGNVYSAMPLYGSAVVKWKLLTRLGNIPLPAFIYNATQGFADDGEVNAPFSLGNGYSIGPANPDNPWLTTAIAGISPTYTVEQGIQEFRLYDTATGVTVGTFEGLTTPTKDVTGIHTLAILVGDTHGSTNVGTQAGQVPPSGTVYTLVYVRNFRTHELYSSMPSADGAVSSLKLVTPWGSLPLPNRFNAAPLPTPTPVQVPGGYTLVPTSDLDVTGLNGLAPMEVLYQGYQRFDVFDSAGTTIGSVDADVSYQSNGVGLRSLISARDTGILITKVNAGTPGTDSTDVPPVGSVFNSQQSLIRGFGRFYSAIPSPTGTVITNEIVTPFGSIRIPTSYDATAGLADATYYDPLLP